MSTNSVTPVVAVTGATGAQGAAIAQAFLAAGWRVRALTRDPAWRGVPAHPGVEPAVVPTGDAAALARALDGVQALAATLPIDHRPGVREAWLGGLLDAAGKAGVERAVLNLAVRVLPGFDHPVSAVPCALEALALSGPVPAAVLRPTVYMDNLLQPWALGPAREHGVFAYPMAPGARVAWISHRTLGEAAVEAASRDSAIGQGFDIGGPEAVTGPEIAALLGRALGREMRFESLDPALLAAGLNAAFGAPAGDDIAAFYRHLPEVPEAMASAPGNAALGVEAESFAEWFARQDFRAAAQAA